MQMGTNHQLWFQVSVRTWFLSLHHLLPSPMHGNLAEWNTNQDPFPLARSHHLPIQFLLPNQWYWLVAQFSALPKRVPPALTLQLRSAPLI
uniref:Uncharacterized protein n=1 Tax=Marmota marmota marmota TaxID=9994 RepID=A0A8C6EY81_MARMA